ncbi:hypothetical protein AAFF_G00053520 [Aldrovandia affinis]|uniref:Uncharacterized protein n=1 Tax=Aldrovandia affinis TaxID=143900 RepID=A0AAD7S163_9TELE|nr:hypothetical protein AAFF_G00053520 [Aldrovandia affinis]
MSGHAQPALGPVRRLRRELPSAGPFSSQARRCGAPHWERLLLNVPQRAAGLAFPPVTAVRCGAVRSYQPLQPASPRSQPASQPRLALRGLHPGSRRGVTAPEIRLSSCDPMP